MIPARYWLMAKIVFDDGTTEPNPFMNWPYRTKFFGVLKARQLNRQADAHTRYFLWDKDKNVEVDLRKR